MHLARRAGEQDRTPFFEAGVYFVKDVVQIALDLFNASHPVSPLFVGRLDVRDVMLLVEGRSVHEPVSSGDDVI